MSLKNGTGECSIADRPGRDGIQSMYQQPYTVNEFARTAAALAKAYHTIFRYLSPHISIHVAGLETSRDLWNELEER
jgi:hypothetical protein